MELLGHVVGVFYFSVYCQAVLQIGSKQLDVKISVALYPPTTLYCQLKKKFCQEPWPGS